MILNLMTTFELQNYNYKTTTRTIRQALNIGLRFEDLQALQADRMIAMDGWKETERDRQTG